ncbi:MAG: hypothetical protein K8T90_07390 [Planctomycetes bacterium]|nr:hypothetical protein [Planctomycetota bacterium]
MSASDPLDDTSPAAHAAQIEVLRRMGPSGRLQAGLRFSAAMIAMSRAALRARHPEADETLLKILWIEEQYGVDLAAAVAHRLGVTTWTPATK